MRRAQMTQDATQRWNRTEGVLVAPGSTPDDVARLIAHRYAEDGTIIEVSFGIRSRSIQS